MAETFEQEGESPSHGHETYAQRFPIAACLDWKPGDPFAPNSKIDSCWETVFEYAKSKEAVFLKPLNYEYPPGFGEKVEEARQLQEEGWHGHALRRYQALNLEIFHESHNFELLPRVAYLQWMTRKPLNARRTYDEARMVYELVTTPAECPSEFNAFAGPITKLEGDYSAIVQESVKSRMCDAFSGDIEDKYLRQYKAELDTLEEILSGGIEAEP